MRSLLLLAFVVPCASHVSLAGGAARYQGTVEHTEFGDAPIDFSLEVFKELDLQEYEGQWAALGAVEKVKISLWHDATGRHFRATDDTTVLAGMMGDSGVLRGEITQEGIGGGTFTLYPVKTDPPEAAALVRAEPARGPTAPLMSPRRQPTPPKMTPKVVTSVSVGKDGHTMKASPQLANSMADFKQTEKLVTDVYYAQDLAEDSTEQLESMEKQVHQQADDVVEKAIQKANEMKQNFTNFKQKELQKIRQAKAEIRAGVQLVLKGKLMELRRMQKEQLLLKRPGLPKKSKKLPKLPVKEQAEVLPQGIVRSEQTTQLDAFEGALASASTVPGKQPVLSDGVDGSVHVVSV